MLYTVVMNSSYTFRLVKELPSFSRGFTAMLDFSKPESKFQTSKTETQADTRALKSDWSAVGKDMKDAITTYDTEHKSK